MESTPTIAAPYDTTLAAIENTRSRAMAAIEVLTIALIACVPLYGIGEIGPVVLPAVFVPIFGRVRDYGAVNTPWWIKAAREAAVVGIIVIATWAQWRTRSATTRQTRAIRWALLGLLAAFGLSAAWSLTRASDPGVAALRLAAGARWAMPIATLLALVGVLVAPRSDRFQRRAAYALSLLFLASFGVQLYQFVLRLSVTGISANNLTGRVGGLFYFPNTSALFTCTALLWSHKHLPRGGVRSAVFFYAPLSILLTSSAAAVLGYVAIMALIAFDGRWLKWRVVLLPVVTLIALANIDVLSLRPDVQGQSLPMRAAILERALGDVGVLSDAFGRGTNIGFNAQRASGQSPDFVITDSFFISAAVNGGWLGLSALAAALVAWGWLAIQAWDRHAIANFALFCIMGTSIVTTEAFPMSLMFAIWLAAELPVLLERWRWFALRASITPR